MNARILSAVACATILLWAGSAHAQLGEHGTTSRDLGSEDREAYHTSWIHTNGDAKLKVTWWTNWNQQCNFYWAYSGSTMNFVGYTIGDPHFIAGDNKYKHGYTITVPYASALSGPQIHFKVECLSYDPGTQYFYPAADRYVAVPKPPTPTPTQWYGDQRFGVIGDLLDTPYYQGNYGEDDVAYEHVLENVFLKEEAARLDFMLVAGDVSNGTGPESDYYWNNLDFRWDTGWPGYHYPLWNGIAGGVPFYLIQGNHDLNSAPDLNPRWWRADTVAEGCYNAWEFYYRAGETFHDFWDLPPLKGPGAADFYNYCDQKPCDGTEWCRRNRYHQKFYSVDRGSLHVIALDWPAPYLNNTRSCFNSWGYGVAHADNDTDSTCTPNPGTTDKSPMMHWLQQDLQTAMTKSRWIVVFMHAPLIVDDTVDEVNCDPVAYPELALLCNMLDIYNVDALFVGHHHEDYLTRVRLDNDATSDEYSDVPMFTVPPGGVPSPNWHGFVHVDVTSTFMRIRTIDGDGHVERCTRYEPESGTARCASQNCLRRFYEEIERLPDGTWPTWCSTD